MRRFYIRNIPLQSLLTRLLFFISGSVLVVNLVFILFYSSMIGREDFRQNANAETALQANCFLSSLRLYGKEGIGKHLQKVKLNDNTRLIVFYDDQGNIIAQRPQNSVIGGPQTIPDTHQNYFDDSDSFWLPWEIGDLHIWYPVNVENERLGTIQIVKDTASIAALVERFLMATFFVSAIAIGMLVLISKRITKHILTPLVGLDRKTQLITDTSDYSIRVSYRGRNEIASLYRSFNRMIQEIENNQRQRDLAVTKALVAKEELELLAKELEERVKLRTEALKESIETLKATQSQLIESEKMAALGDLVSGVAHEINTPLGNAVTGGSIVQHESRGLIEALENESLKRSTLLSKLQLLDESSTLMMKSLRQAASLVKGFKQVSIDQVSEEKRVFNLHAYIEEILTTFHNKLKKAPVAVIIHGDASLQINSYPGVFAQILNNFVQNTLLHAFRGVEDGAKIDIFYTIEDSILELRFSDNGEGISPMLKKIIFEPFVTTRRNKGGTGLGLNIVYNLVTQKLGGSLRVHSEPGEGTTFVIKVPVEISQV